MIKALKTCAGLVKAQCLLLTVLRRGGPASELINDLVLDDSYGLISRWNGGETWEELNSEKQQELDESWKTVMDSQQAFLGTDGRIGNLFTVRR